MGVLDPLYAALGVSSEASPEDVKKAFRKVARECHPDVAGDDPAKAERFKAARDAYEVLTDGTKRALYEAQNTAPPPPKARKGRNPEEAGAFFRAFYKRASGGAAAPEEPKPRHTHSGTFRARNASTGGPADGLDDLFKDFGFGSGEAQGPRPRAGGPPPSQGRRGDDVILDLEVPADVAQAGGTVMASYVHLARDPSWRQGDPSPGVVPRHDQVPLEIEPNTKHGQIRRFRGLGDAGPHGGTIGDLVCRMRVLDEAEPRPQPEERGRPSTRTEGRQKPKPEERREPPLDGSARRVVDISVFEALLGGRIEVATPSGRVRVAIPPCTSSGRQLRLKGRGPLGIDGQPGDLVLELRIVVPERLDDASLKLVEELARLNPEVPER
jgi:DnaJ-class molecular chaperone